MIFSRILVGAALLTLGRKLFWLFVAGIGFFAAITLASRFLPAEQDWLQFAIALVTGLLGAVLAIFLQKAAIYVAGFIAGAYFIPSLVEILGIDLGDFSWIAFVVGGLIGVLLLGAIFNWALILLSSLSGAFLVAQSFQVDFPRKLPIFVGAFVIGVVIQSILKHREKEPV